MLAAAPRVAVFDCDGTLWSGDSGFGFMHWSLDHGLVPEQAATVLRARYREYEAGRVDEAAICGEMVQVYAGLRETVMREAAARFFAEKIEPLIFPVMESLVAALRRAGTDIWAVSSTCDWVVDAGVRERFGIPPERVLAAKVRREGDIVTGELQAVPTDEAKAEALRAIGIARPDAAFGNSVHDLAMLTMARHPYPVNPSAELVAYANRAGWPVFRPGSAMTSR